MLPLCSGERVDSATVAIGRSTIHYKRLGTAPTGADSIHIGKSAPDGTDLASFSLIPPEPLAGFSLDPPNPAQVDLDRQSRWMVTISTSLRRYHETLDGKAVSPSVAVASSGTLATGDPLSFYELLSVGNERCGRP